MATGAGRRERVLGRWSKTRAGRWAACSAVLWLGAAAAACNRGGPQPTEHAQGSGYGVGLPRAAWQVAGPSRPTRTSPDRPEFKNQSGSPEARLTGEPRHQLQSAESPVKAPPVPPSSGLTAAGATATSGTVPLAQPSATAAARIPQKEPTVKATGVPAVVPAPSEAETPAMRSGRTPGPRHAR